MIRTFAITCSILALAGTLVVASAAPAPTVVSPSQIHWVPGTGALKGTQVANLFGNPAKPGAFVTRVHMPDGITLGPHFHPVLENVTVLQGTLMIGIGDKVDVAKMVSLPAGSFFSVPPNVHHYAMSKGDTIIQLNDVGPWAMTPVKM
ncbi:MAG TPA: cupin domain-containing protein [Candidatus Cybelea sp.]